MVFVDELTAGGEKANGKGRLFNLEVQQPGFEPKAAVVFLNRKFGTAGLSHYRVAVAGKVAVALVDVDAHNAGLVNGGRQGGIVGGNVQSIAGLFPGSNVANARVEFLHGRQSFRGGLERV